MSDDGADPAGQVAVADPSTIFGPPDDAIGAMEIDG